MKRRAVITGIGLVSPLGNDTKECWEKLIACQSGISKITSFDTTKIPSKVAGIVKDFNPETFMEPKDIPRTDRFIHLGLKASIEALEDSNLQLKNENLARAGVVIGSGLGGFNMIAENALKLEAGKRISPFFMTSSLINMASSYVSIKYGFTGPNLAVSNACATGLNAIIDAANIITRGDADFMVAGGAESIISPLGLSSFTALRALSTGFNDEPHKASRPWDVARDGFVLAEGAGIVIVEEFEHAVSRGAKIYGEILGYGATSDAYHITAPDPEGKGMKQVMLKAMKNAKITTDKIDYINAHGTSTLIGDKLELESIQEIFSGNEKILISSTKSSTGHMLGAAGSAEVIFTLLAMQNNIAPATLNLDMPDDFVKIDLVANKTKKHKIDIALSNSFGFGGTNSCIVLKKLS